jgi:hypothetical protein
MNQREQIAYWQRVGCNINHRHALAWFMGVNLPIAIVLSIFVGWHNALVGEPTAMHLLMRASVALAAFGVGFFLVFHKVFKPAVQAEAKRANQEKRTNKSEMATPRKPSD